jgi:ribosomal protein L11 methyltransferase
MHYLKYNFTIKNDAESEMLMALLSNAGFESFEETKGSLSAFIPQQNDDSIELDGILKIIPSLFTKQIIEPQNWNQKWERSFDPIQVDDFVAVRAAFHTPIVGVTHEIIITPKMSFGTGHHATTYMMMQQMKSIDFLGKQVVDYGSGTGLLAILAEKMGAKKIVAIDYDDWCIENASENIAANECANVALIKNDTIGQVSAFDVVLANINLNIILSNVNAIKNCCKPNATILLSGFLVNDLSQITSALKINGVNYISHLQNGEWICVLAKLAVNNK